MGDGDSKVSDFKNLAVWVLGMEIAENVYSVTKAFPKDELYGITSQIRRAAVSIPSNIAEGWSRKNIKEYIQFLFIAKGSLSELETQLLLAKRVIENIDQLKVEAILNKILSEQKMLSALVKKLNQIK